MSKFNPFAACAIHAVQRFGFTCENLEPRRLFSAQTIEVVNGLDESGSDQAVAGSLRAAINIANANPGSTIAFDQLPASTTIILNAALPPITAANTTINGETGPGARVQINGGGQNALTLESAGDTVKGLWITASNQGLTLDAGSSDASIQDNWIGDVMNTGSNAVGYGLVITNGSQDNLIGGTAPADRNVISGNTVYNASLGVLISDPGNMGTTGNVVEGNYIGLNPTGLTSSPNTQDGLQLNSVHGNTVEGNLISGNQQHGIETFDSNAGHEYGNTITNNQIGLNAANSNAAANGYNGIQLNNSTSAVIGDLVSHNTIVGNTTVNPDCTGILVRGSGNVLSSNSISGNGARGIELDTGYAARNTFSQNILTANDTSGHGLGIDLNNNDVPLPNSTSGGSSDTGPNGDQPYPVLTVTDAGDGTHLNVGLSLASNINTQYTVELFANTPAAASPSGFGEAQTYITSATLTTGLSGVATGSVQISKASFNGDYITATATNSSSYNASSNPDAGATSEFSQNVAAPGVVVVGSATSHVALTPSAPTIVSGSAETLTATVTGASGMPSGTVTFLDGSTTLGAGTVNASGVATFTTSTLTTGSHAISARYAGDSVYATSTSTPQAVTVTASSTLAVSTTTLTESAATINAGAPLTLNVAVRAAAPGGPAPTGTLLIEAASAGAIASQTVTLQSDGTATLQLPTPQLQNLPGEYAITAHYSGDGNYAPSASPATGLTIMASGAGGAGVDLGGTISFATSAPVKPGKSAPETLVITNHGDKIASGALRVVLGLSQNANGSSPLTTTTLTKRIKLAAGGQTTLRVAAKLPPNTAPGTYFATASIDPGNVFADSNVANNSVTSANSITVPGRFPSLLGTWSGPTHIKKGYGQSQSLVQGVTFNTQNPSTGAYTFTGTNYYVDGTTAAFAGEGNITTNGLLTWTAEGVPSSGAFGTAHIKAKLVGNTIRGTLINAIQTATFVFTRD